MEKFIVIWASVDNGRCPNASAVLFETFEDALKYARHKASFVKHLANKYTELVGVNKKHARIYLEGKYISASIFVSDLGYDKSTKILDKHLNTYASWDYLHDDVAI